jgi:AIG2-like family
LQILKENEVVPEEFEVSKLPGYDFQISSRGYLIQSDRHTVYGLAASLTFEDLNRLYSASSSILTKQYFPVPVLVETVGGKLVKALCYVLPEIPTGTVNQEYAEKMVKLAEHYDFPEWYVERLAAFKTSENIT